MKIARALAVAVTVCTLACDPSPVGIELPPPALQASRLQSQATAGSLVRCTPLPYDSVTQAIGPEGGTLTVGIHKLVVPPLALTNTVNITAVAPSDTVNLVRFGPNGLVFQHPAFLVMSYANCKVRLIDSPRIAQVTDGLDLLAYVLSLNDFLTKRVIGQLNHFSGYAMSW